MFDAKVVVVLSKAYRINAHGIRTSTVHSHRVVVRIGVEEEGCIFTAKLEVIANTNSPAGAEQVDGLGKHVVVDEACVHAEDGHEEYDVSATVEYFQHFVSFDLFLHFFFLANHEESGQEHEQTMAQIAEHERKQEGKRDHSERRRIDFLVTGDTVGVHDVLKTGRELVDLVVRGRLFGGVDKVNDGLGIGSSCFLKVWSLG